MSYTVNRINNNNSLAHYTPDFTKGGGYPSEILQTLTLPDTIEYDPYNTYRYTNGEIKWKMEACSNFFIWCSDVEGTKATKIVNMGSFQNVYITHEGIQVNINSDYIDAAVGVIHCHLINFFLIQMGSGDNYIFSDHDGDKYIEFAAMTDEEKIATIPNGGQWWLYQCMHEGVSYWLNYESYAKLVEAEKQYANTVATYQIEHGKYSNPLRLVAHIVYWINTLHPQVTKKYSNNTWNTSKTFYIKTTFTKNTISDTNQSGNVVNYVTSILKHFSKTYYSIEATYRVAGFILLKSIIINKKTRGRLMPTSNLFSI